ncbi:hypothetical protein [Piscinibacter sakaiensis]|uniref:hypothetical protein n=1 Tax=Piscinibacter sakaiensis TaxID=1547922 RepID=UPI003AAFD25D
MRLDIDEERVAALGGAGIFATSLGERLRQAGLRVATAGPTDFTLRGTVTSQASANRRLALNDISVSAAVNLTTPDGQLLSSHLTRGDSYAGSDLAAVYREVVDEQAIDIAGQVYRELCKR